MTKQRRTVLIVAAVAITAVIATVALRSRHEPLVLIGVIDANDIVVTPRVQGRLDSLLVDEGSEVKAGQLVASLESSELAAQAASVAAATSGATAQLGESRSSALQLTGSTAATLSSARARVASAKATLAREHAQLAQDSADAGRATTLVRAGAMSPAEVERANTTYHAQQSVVAARVQEVSAAEADLASAQSGTHAVAAARSAVANTAARVLGARADSTAAAARLNYAALRAPVSGIVQVITARRGELVGPGSPVMVIVDPDHLWVRVAAPETDAGSVAVGDSLDVRLPSGQSLRGRVISKGAEGEFATQHDVSSEKRDIRAVAFRVAIPNPRRVLVPGMTVQVLLPTKP
ncbi:MAG: efflux RND transporter periplasmic adaptor subunit [bacterium]